MTRKEILDTSNKIVNGDRDEQYGTPEDSFKVIAELWTVYLNGREISGTETVYVFAKDVAVMMALLKIARIAGGDSKSDNWIDLAGYAACGGEIDTINEVRA